MDAHKPVVPSLFPKNKSAVDDVVSLTLGAAMEESGEEEFMPKKLRVSLKQLLLSRGQRRRRGNLMLIPTR